MEGGFWFTDLNGFSLCVGKRKVYSSRVKNLWYFHTDNKLTESLLNAVSKFTLLQDQN